MPSPVQRTAIRGRFLDFKNCTSQADQISEQVRYVDDGLLICEQGKIQWFGSWQEGQAAAKRQH